MKQAKCEPKTRKQSKQSNNTVLKQKKVKSPYINTLITMLCVYLPNLLLSINKEDVISALMTNQSGYGGLAVNILVILAAAYSKFSDEYFLHKKVYWLSFFAFCTAIVIFAQANAYISSDFNLAYDWVSSFCMTLVLHVMLILFIFALYRQNRWHVILKYNKIVLTNE